MSKTDNLQLEIPSAADKHIFTTYKNNNEIIDEAYGQYLEDLETSQENIAMIESSTAQSNHAIGSYFMLDNVLHKATSAIASGETITSGSNATPITIEEALTALNTSVNSLRDSVGMFYPAATGSLSVATNKIYTGSRNYMFRYGRFVIATVVFGVNTACNGGETILTMPNGFLPRGYSDGECPFMYGRCDNGDIGLFTIKHDGIRTDTGLPKDSAWRMTGMYMIDITQS